MFDEPRENEFTQGTVFSCAYAEDYPDSSVYGLVITARCDAAQDKAPIFSYIPVVPLHDWVLCDGANNAMDRIDADCHNTLKNYLKKASLSESLLETKTVNEIYDAHFKVKESERDWATPCTKMRATMENYAKNQRLRTSRESKEERRLHLVENSGKVDGVIKELSGNRLAGFYLFREMPSLNGDKASYVALLREIHHIPTNLAREIVDGLAKDEWVARQESNMRCPRFVGDSDLAAPVAKLKSPWIEHLMQNFTMLFARIGVADNDYASVRQSLASIGLG
ncbi:hypothetical protein [Ralstonia pseudosolanacearum]|uniref:hypothetical protein n=1 Tax=Ralstonia pseudosolanacearum TaxID=1310165 RepID=UPI000E58AE36|nr:hypothetical protein [Ralstonia pseudosolanacearum]AXW39906.1 hypothetical protein CJO89_00025 [Ralstonia solanacearum]MCK4152871.1 hypothetical protein [Ralstonia pseudosolanacearum]